MSEGVMIQTATSPYFKPQKSPQNLSLQAAYAPKQWLNSADELPSAKDQTTVIRERGKRITNMTWQDGKLSSTLSCIQTEIFWAREVQAQQPGIYQASKQKKKAAPWLCRLFFYL